MGLYFLLKNQKGWQNQVLVVQHGDYCPKPGLAVALGAYSHSGRLYWPFVSFWSNDKVCSWFWNE